MLGRVAFPLFLNHLLQVVTDTDQEPKELFAEVVAAAKISDGSDRA